MQHHRFDDDNSIDNNNGSLINTTSLQFLKDDIIPCCKLHEDEFIPPSSGLDSFVFEEVKSSGFYIYGHLRSHSSLWSQDQQLI